jgi:hypothetical protein
MEASAAPDSHVAKRRRRVLVAMLLSLAVAFGLLAVVATWLNRQALNTGAWTDTSSRLLADKDVQKAVSAYMVDELFSSVDVAAEIQKVLPPQAAALAGPAAAGLQELAGRTAPRLLASPKVQDAWRGANELAHAQLLRILDDGGGVVSTTGGEVVLDLRALIDRLAGRLGVQEQVAAARSQLQGQAGATARGVAQQRLGIELPPESGKIVIMKSENLALAQSVARGVRNLAILLTGLALLLFALAVFLAVGWRRIALRSVGWCFIGLGLFVLLVRRVAGDRVVDALVSSETVKPAAESAWTIGTTLLYDIAIAMFAYGVVFVVAAWLAGATRPAIGLRRQLAPALRFHLGSVYGAVAIAFLLLLAWGPTPATRKPLGIIAFALLIVLGIELLRRLIAREHPNIQPGESGARLRAWFASARGRTAGLASRSSSRTEPTAGPDPLEHLERLAALHDRGVLSDAEFDTQKVLILNGAAQGP